MQIQRLNHIVLFNMRFMKKEKLYQKAISPGDLKRIFWECFSKLLKDEEEKKRFIKGAKLIDFELIYKIIKN